MSNLIEIVYLSGRNVYAVIHANGQVWNTNTLTFENYNSAHWSQYVISLTEQTGSGYYSVAYPAAIPEGTISTEVLYQQNGDAPTLGDTYLSIGQTQGTVITGILGDGVSAINLKTSLNTEVRGAAITGTLSTTQMTTNLTSLLTNNYLGRTIIWTSGALTGTAASVVGYNTTTKKLSFTAVPVAPANGDKFIIV